MEKKRDEVEIFINLALVVGIIIMLTFLIVAIVVIARDDFPFDEERFTCISYADHNSGGTVVDKETRVMYTWIHDSSGDHLAVIVDENGNPVLYRGEL